MRASPMLFAAAIIAFPQSLAAAEVAIACALSDETVSFTPPGATSAMTAEQHISENVRMRIGDDALFTPVGAPCDRMDAQVTASMVDASCSFPPIGSSEASLAIRIDRDTGVISEVWDILEQDGSESHNSKAGLCAKGKQPPKPRDQFVAQAKDLTVAIRGN
jgi:hypothetical protein